MRPFLALLAAVAVAGCGSTAAEAPAPVAEGPPPLEQAEDGNVTLYVSNQSFERADVDIRVVIDGRPAVAESFAVDNQHNWVEFRFRLEEGPHTLRAESLAGEAALEKSFQVAGKRWAVLDYWCCNDPSEPKFTFRISDEPVAFA